MEKDNATEYLNEIEKMSEEELIVEIRKQQMKLWVLEMEYKRRYENWRKNEG